MATSSKISLSTSHKPIFYTPTMNDAAANRTSELLQENHEKYHIFFNESHFHNHIVHHLLTIYALGASPEDITKGYKNNQYYQRSAVPLQKEIVQSLHDDDMYMKYLGQEKYYRDFMVFFINEIESKGLKDTLDKYLFANTPLANELFGRMYAGLLHPVIHFGLGVEFNQIPIIAEGLAETAVHENWLGPLLAAAEKEAEKYNGPEKTLSEIIEEVRNDKRLDGVVQEGDDNKTRDGIMKRGFELVAKIAGQFKVTEESLDKRTAEMLSNILYYVSASQNSPKAIKYDFVNIHHTNAAIFFPVFNAHPDISTAAKIRLVEWKARFDIIHYIAANRPPLHPEDIKTYKPREPSGWDGILARAAEYPDDGHTSKLIRVLALGEQHAKKYSGQKGFVVQDDWWEKMGHMAIDSVDNGSGNWIRNIGWPGAWNGVPNREDSRL